MNVKTKRRTRGATSTPPRTASPILRAVFVEMMRQNISAADLAARIKWNKNKVSVYRTGSVEPGIMSVEEMAAAIGCRLVLEPIEPRVVLKGRP